jgi:hypothetical protein
MTLARILCAVLALPMIAGCGNGLANVSGTVTLGGEPVVGGPQVYGTVTFCRDDGGGASAVGVIDASGRYTLMTGAQPGIEPGSYLVGVAVKKITLPATRDAMPLATLVTPRKYASVTESGLREDVKPGSNTFDFAMSSQRSE